MKLSAEAIAALKRLADGQDLFPLSRGERQQLMEMKYIEFKHYRGGFGMFGITEAGKKFM